MSAQRATKSHPFLGFPGFCLAFLGILGFSLASASQVQAQRSQTSLALPDGDAGLRMEAAWRPSRLNSPELAKPAVVCLGKLWPELFLPWDPNKTGTPGLRPKFGPGTLPWDPRAWAMTCECPPAVFVLTRDRDRTPLGADLGQAELQAGGPGRQRQGRWPLWETRLGEPPLGRICVGMRETLLGL